MDLIDIYRTFLTKTTEHTFFSSAHGTFSRIDHILGHKSILGKFKKIEIISSIFSDHNVMRLEINYRGKICKKHKHMEAKQYVTNTNWKRRSKTVTVDHMILYIDNPKDATRKLLELINEFGKVAGYKINAQNSLAFLYTNNERSEREIKETIPFTIATKRIKY